MRVATGGLHTECSSWNPVLMQAPVNQDVARLPVTRIRRPIFPWDTTFTWQPVVLASARTK